MDRRNSAEAGESTRVQIEVFGSGTITSELTSSIQKTGSGMQDSIDSVSSPKTAVRPPEMDLTLFALRLAVLEKAATGLGTLAFVWATVVLLGGFAVVLDSTDFWKLIKHDYGEVEKEDTEKRNRKGALYFFYSLALAEALLFLMEKAYCEWKVSFCRLLDKVNEECDFGPSGRATIRRFFYDAYSRCVNGSIFDGLQMDMFTFATDLLVSNSPEEQLIGVRILQKFALSERFSHETLQKIGINLSVIERLVEMLNWTDPEDEEIRRSAAEILSKLAGKKQNSLRISGIAGAMESISSLLQRKRSSSSEAEEISEKKTIDDHANYDWWTFNDLGLHILKKLARDRDNCGKIGNTRGLLTKIIGFSHAEYRLLQDKTVAVSQIRIVKRSLQVVEMLANTTGTTGKQLRKEISEIVFTVSNIRDILRYGEMHPKLQKHGILILTSLAQEQDATERIGSTGGILKDLFSIFFKEGTTKDQNNVRTAAGEALTYLALESQSNCHRILKLHVLERLVEAQENSLLRLHAAKILRHLCTYSAADLLDLLKGVTAAAPTVIQAIVLEENKPQEVMLGLAARSFNLMTPEESSINFKRAKVTETALATVLVQILDKHRYPPVKFPKIRRFAIELAIWMMRDNKTDVCIFKDLETERVLENVLETTTELESFNIVSGAVGLYRHGTTIHSLVETALKVLDERWKGKDPATG
ncbi:hypothetical protein CJ030_MR5G027220 [Morella rubra]|uniref:Uncharacterized protein n=1 Tax=Morella rubra TaxID=262757 RepID=A0A6A1VNC9_9ROSI|nr:hypothetical protein CJ030_MR5G027220 [Morella rubra]